jgi:hypothetical protein
MRCAFLVFLCDVTGYVMIPSNPKPLQQDARLSLIGVHVSPQTHLADRCTQKFSNRGMQALFVPMSTPGVPGV